jgi:ABC-type transport system substrate-binding protein
MRRLLTLAALLSALAFAKPNLAGDWKMNASKSEFGAFPAPSSMTQKIAHEDPSLKVAAKMSTDNGDMDFESVYTTDGKECTNQFGPNVIKSTVKWDGDTLVIDGKGQFGDNEVTIKDKWELSADGKVLTILRHWASSMGEMDQKLVFEKQ